MAENHEAIHHTTTSSSPIFDEGDATSVIFHFWHQTKISFLVITTGYMARGCIIKTNPRRCVEGII